MKTVLLFLFFFSPSLIFANEPICNAPNQKQLTNFFRESSHWIEVRAKDSKKKETNKTLEIRIDFDSPLQSQFFKGKKSMGRLSSVCFDDKKQNLKVVGGGKDITLKKLNNGAIQSTIKFLGISFVYFYRPQNEIIKDKNNPSDDILQWANIPQ